MAFCAGIRFRPVQSELAPPQRRPPGFAAANAIRSVTSQEGDYEDEQYLDDWEPGTSPALEEWVKELVDQRVDLMEVRANLVKAEISDVIRSSIASTVDSCLLKQRLAYIQPMDERLAALEAQAAVLPHHSAGDSVAASEVRPSPKAPLEDLPKNAPHEPLNEAAPESSPEARGCPHERVDGLAEELEPMRQRLARLSDDVAPLAGRVAAIESWLRASRIDSWGMPKSSKQTSSRRCFKLCDGQVNKGKQCYSFRRVGPLSCQDDVQEARPNEADVTMQVASRSLSSPWRAPSTTRRGRHMEEYRNFVSATVTVVRTSLLVSDAGPDAADVVILSGGSSDRRRLSQEVQVLLTKTPGQPLGFQLASEAPGGSQLHITSIVEGGVLDEWNVCNPEARVAAGDRIVQVNGARAEGKIRDALAVKGGQLVMVVRRRAGDGSAELV